MADWVFYAPLEFKLGIISGYWSGDGSIYISKKDTRPRASALTNSKKLAIDLQNLLSNVGIQSSCRYYYREYPLFKNASPHHWRMFISGNDICKCTGFNKSLFG